MSWSNEAATEGASTGFLSRYVYADPAAFKQQLAVNWGWIMAAGALNLVGGIMALCSPIAATVTILGLLAFGMIFLGITNMFGVFYFEQCYRVPAFVGGLFIALLGILMAANVFLSLSVLTILVAITYMLEGIARSAIALLNRDMYGRMSVLISGISAILLSLIIISAFPVSSEYTLGILLGVNWITYGVQRIFLGMYGRATSNQALATSSGGDYMNAP